MIANSPTKFAEYLARGLPILTNAGIGDSDEILQQERVGVIVEEFVRGRLRARPGRHPAAAGRARPGRTAAGQAAERRFALHTVGRAGYARVYRALGWTTAPL